MQKGINLLYFLSCQTKFKYKLYQNNWNPSIARYIKRTTIQYRVYQSDWNSFIVKVYYLDLD